MLRSAVRRTPSLATMGYSGAAVERRRSRIALLVLVGIVLVGLTWYAFGVSFRPSILDGLDVSESAVERLAAPVDSTASDGRDLTSSGSPAAAMDEADPIPRA